MADLKSKIGILGIIGEKIREQTFVVILLVAFGYWMSMKNDACNEKQIELLQTVVNENTKVLGQCVRVLEKILEK
jgi:hypothetical protein